MPNQSYMAEHAYEYTGGSPASSAIGRTAPRTGSVSGVGDRTRTRETPKRRRSVSRTPDMSTPRARAKQPSVSIGGTVGLASEAKKAESYQIRTVKRAAAAPIPVGMIMTAIFCTLLFMYMIFNFVKINESTIRVSSLRSELNSLTAEAKDLDLRLEQKNNLAAIEEYAVSVLGMVKTDQLTKRQVNTDSTDKIETATEEEDREVGVFSSALDAFRDRIDEIMEYIG